MWKNRLIVILCIVGSSVLIGVRGGTGAYFLFYTSLLLPCFSLIYSLYVFSRFCIYQKLEHRTVVKEERIPYTFRLANEDKIPYFSVSVEFLKDYSTVEQVDMEKEYSLSGGGDKQFYHIDMPPERGISGWDFPREGDGLFFFVFDCLCSADEDRDEGESPYCGACRLCV